MGDESLPQPLAVNRHVVGDALGNGQPDGVGGEDERAVLAEGGVDSGEEGLVVDVLDDGSVIVGTALDRTEHLPYGLVGAAFG